MSTQQKIGFLFPGQGAQYPGMGKDFVSAFPQARLVLEEADDILGRKLSSIILEGPENLLTETRNSQTGIYVASVAMLGVLRSLFPALKPVFCSGLSLGEYTALYAAGKLSFADCLNLINHRSQFMNDACEATNGTMAVVMGLDADIVEQIVKAINLPNDLWAANFNCPGQVVISGTLRGIEAGSEAAKAKGAKRVLPLQVHGAFHSGLMREAEQRLKPYLEDAKFNDSAIEVIMNVSGAAAKDNAEIRQNLIKQVTQPVKWEQGVRVMDKAGVGLFIEIGCGKVLSGFNKRIGIQGTTINIESIKDLEDVSKFA